MSLRTAFLSLAVLVVFGGMTIVFTLGWWAPNVGMWRACGANEGFAVLRGVFERPDTLTCLAMRG